jgi:Kef-type K+ transport system membrane component KefB
MRTITRVLPVALLAALFPSLAAAAEGSGGTESSFPLLFFFLVLMLLFARIGAMAEKKGQPAVLGELVMGVLLGALALAPGFRWMGPLGKSEFIHQVAEIGVILLLFRTGLESNVGEMMRVGVRALLVACVGVALPFIGGYFVSAWLLPGLSSNTYLFIGATLTATSVGITARVFKDLGVLKTREAKIVLGAAVIDDVLGLLILAIVAGIVSSGIVSAAQIAVLSLKALAFLAGAIVVGQLAAPRLGRWFSRIHSGVGMKMALALLFCGAFSYGAAAVAGLAPIVGAFAAGLVLDPLHFKWFACPSLAAKIREWAGRVKADQGLATEMCDAADHEEESHVENLIEGVSAFFVPIFFVYTGMQVNLQSFADLGTVGIALAVTGVAVIGKVLCGYAAGKDVDRTLIGFGMVPRGEVGLIFANVGKELGVVNDRVFAVAVIMVILTTLISPPILGSIIRSRGRTRP